MKKTRVTVIIGNFDIGGAQEMVYQQIKDTDRERYDVQVVCYDPKHNTFLEAQAEAIMPVTYLKRRKFGRVTPDMIARVVWALQRTKPDVVHAHLSGVGFGTIWSMLFRKPLVVTVHSKPEEAFLPRTEKLLRSTLKAGLAKLVAVSQDNDRLVKEYFCVDDRQCSIVNNGIDLDRFARKPHDGFTLINVARQDKNKNQAALIRCFARLHEKHPDTKLLLLGDGPTHKALQQQVKQLGLEDSVTLTGNVSNTQDYYAVSDLYVQCSHQEAMPMSVLEAMAANLPIVSTDVGGLKDVVRDNGILVPDNDEDALYRAIKTIYTQTPEETQAMRQASDEIVQGYSSKNMARQYEKIYDEMTKVKRV